MNRLQGVFGIPLAWAALANAAWAQAPPGADPAVRPRVENSGPANPDGNNRKGWLAWLKLSIEWRGRAEATTTFDRSGRDEVYLNRLRINGTAQPTPWIRVSFQGQDARAASLGTGRDHDELRNTVDLHQAYVDLGGAEQGWQLRAGRQELAFGDERLVGADNYWDCFGQAFDAFRLSYSDPRLRASAFSGFRVRNRAGPRRQTARYLQ